LIKIFCDGCSKRGVDNELTGRDYARVTFLEQNSQILHLCKDEGCYAMYERFEHRYKRETRKHAELFREKIQGLMDEMWKEVRGGSPEEENATESGEEIRAV
jgi:hypothetical protein